MDQTQANNQPQGTVAPAPVTGAPTPMADQVNAAAASPFSYPTAGPTDTASSSGIPSAPAPEEVKLPTVDTVSPTTSTPAPAGAAGTTSNNSTLADLAKKLSGWKDDYLKKNGGEKTAEEPTSEPIPAAQPEPVASTPLTPSNDTSKPEEPKTEDKPELPPLVEKPVEEQAPAVPSVPKPLLGAMPNTLNPDTAAAQPSGPMLEKKNTKPGQYPYTIEQLLQLVVDKDASDLHLTVGYPAKIRIDGELLNVSDDLITDENIQDLIAPVLPDNKKELLEVNREVDLAYAFKDVARFRVNTYYERGSVAAALRLIPNRIRTIEELKLPGAYHQLAKLPQGFVLVTGPTGHGKSTTLAAIIQEINETEAKHIITIEDPIEYIYPKAKAMVDQREMHEDTHSWEIALRSALRQDPNVVLVGEMRDYETIAAAITLAETGHLVFATLHTNNAAQTIDRIIDVFPEHQQSQVRVQLSNILEAIISQRLIPVKGGGRRAVSEILLCNPAVRSLIREGKSHQIDNVIRTSLDIGMKSLEHSLVDLVREGVISLEDAEAQAIHPEEIVRLMK